MGRQKKLLVQGSMYRACTVKGLKPDTIKMLYVLAISNGLSFVVLC